jgi:predicted NAD-dependent protein-ADP-ribosyltransferase YbiA (DUF1768 family)
MGKPGWSDPVTAKAEPTQGTETSKYLEEEKSKEIPLVAASEEGLAQTRGGDTYWGCGASWEGLERIVERSGKADHRG